MKEWLEIKFEKEIIVISDMIRIYKQNKTKLNTDNPRPNLKIKHCPTCGLRLVESADYGKRIKKGVIVERVECNACKNGYR